MDLFNIIPSEKNGNNTYIEKKFYIFIKNRKKNFSCKIRY